MHPTLVLDVVGLSRSLIGPHTPALSSFAASGTLRALEPILPAVTCSVQSTFVTGTLPSEHGIVGNGWYFRDLDQILFWRQSNHLVAGEKIWDLARRRDSSFTSAKLFWWYNMYASVDFSVTPRPMYTSDGRKIPDVYSEPPELRTELSREIGTFPLFQFWGPRAGIESSKWIARAAERVIEERSPTLTLVYLPHLDYDLQRCGPGSPEAARAAAAVDAVCSDLLSLAAKRGMRVVVLSEYAITGVGGAVHPNRVLREAGLLRVREELGRELLDPGASEAFAVCDHQIAHVYVRRPERLKAVAELLGSLPEVERVLGEAEQRAQGLFHPRSGELVLVARPDRWFSYYFWLDDARAPDYARTVDIHQKPGYDPVELFVDPKIAFPTLTVGRKLLQRKLGFRTLLDVIPLDTSLVRGSHGRVEGPDADGPVFLTSEPDLVPPGPVPAVAVRDLILKHLFE